MISKSRLFYKIFPLTFIGLFSIVSLAFSTPEAPKKWALLIGIDEYKAGHISDLRGCVNDIKLMKNVLIGKFNIPPENVLLLPNEQATRKGIINAIQSHLIAKAQKDDVVILHYSGHGSQMRDISGDEIDHWDETIVPHDSRIDGVFDISDDEINGLLKQLTEKTKNVAFLFDSCHSGDAARAGNTIRMTGADNRPPPPPADFAISTRGGEGEADFRLEGSDYVLISGCLAKQLSNEATFNNKRHGVLTWYLSHALEAAVDDTTYRSVMDEVKAEVSAEFPSQNPQIEGPGTDLVVFGTDKINPRPYVLVKPSRAGYVDLDGGKVYGLRNDTILKVYPPQTVNFDNTAPVATIEITNSEDFKAEAKIVDGGNIEPHSRAILEAAFFGERWVPIFVNTSQSGSLKQIKDKLEGMGALKLVAEEQDARIAVQQQGDKIFIQTGDLEVLVMPVPIAEQGHVERVVDQVKDLVHWFTVLGLKNPTSDLKINFEVRRKDDPANSIPPGEVTPDTILTYTVHNQTDQSIFVYVLDVSSDGSVALLNKKPGDQELPEDGILNKSIRMKLPNGHQTVLDVLKVIATTQQIDPLVFPQGSIRTAPPAKLRGKEDPLASFLANSLRGIRAAEPIEVDSWTTRQTSVRIRETSAILSRFSAHFDESRDIQDVMGELGKTRSLCIGTETFDNKDCDQVLPASKDGSAFEIIPYGPTRGEIVNVSVGKSFDRAYEYQDQTGALRVEPLLEVQAPGIENERGIDKRDISGDNQHDEMAGNNDQWSLKQIQVFDAWKKIRDRYGLAEGSEANGILIAHPDTGYREHPENWEENNGKRPIDVAKGYDYFDGDKDPLDPLLSNRWLDNPGHGTASGSVIVSPAGCQLPGAKGCVNGIARGAQLIPLRVHRTVSQFNMGNLARAIRDSGEGNVPGQPKLVSIAMGGPPTYSLWKAVKTAEKNGVLIVAAAGNYVRIVVWPARFRSTIAAAANNVRCRPWKHSSRGNAVDISAPGESVWRATLNEDHDYINAMGKGTTFATGNTAGAAALWLAWHRGDSEMDELRSKGLVTEAFRRALQSSVWQPSDDPADNPPGTSCDTAPWDFDYGNGLLNVAALLDAPLDVSETRGIQKEELEELPLFSSLYPPGTDPEKIRSDYLLLLGETRSVDFQKLTSFETEILYHYTMSREVQRSLESIVQGKRSIEPASRAREALLKRDLSQRFRKTLDK